MNCPVCEKETDDDVLDHLPLTARVLCFQCQKNAKTSIRLKARFKSDRQLTDRIKTKVTLLEKDCAGVFYIDDYILSREEFIFLSDLFTSNFSGYMIERWPDLKVKRYQRNREELSGKITNNQLNDYLIMKLGQLAKKKRI